MTTDRNSLVAAAKTFFDDVPPTSEPKRQPRVTKETLATAHTIKHQTGERYKAITGLAGTIGYHESNVREQAQAVYMLIDDTTPDDGEVDTMLASAYQALTRAAQLLFEAQTHILRYVNRLENERLAEEALQTEMFAEHDPIGNHGV